MSEHEQEMADADWERLAARICHEPEPPVIAPGSGASAVIVIVTMVLFAGAAFIAWLQWGAAWR